MIRLVLADLDNTLVPFGANTASPRSIRAIHACLDAGVLFGPATGRDRTEVAGFLNHDEACYATGVFVNGQQVMLDGRLLTEVALDRVELCRLEELVTSHGGCALIIFRPDGKADWVGDEPEALGSLFMEGMRNGSVRQRRLPGYEVVKAGIIANMERDEELALQRELRAACPHLDFLNTVPRWFDVVPRGWNKASGLRLLCDELGIPASEVCVFGDAVNDLALFEMAGHSCAVANASEEVRRKARWQVGASEEDGVAIALEQIAEAAQTGTTPAFMARQAARAAGADDQGVSHELRVVPYTPDHADELRAVCLAQASERARTSKAHGRFTRLMYCDAYLEHGVAYMLVDSTGVARGYVLAAEDARRWRRDFEPYRRQIAALGLEYEWRVDEELDFYESVADEYPAHLHIDIAEEWTGRGGGRLLMDTLLARLRADGVRGVVFGVAAANRRAVGFYRHMGFSKLSEYSDGAGYTFCMRMS